MRTVRRRLQAPTQQDRICVVFCCGCDVPLEIAGAMFLQPSQLQESLAILLHGSRRSGGACARIQDRRRIPLARLPAVPLPCTALLRIQRWPALAASGIRVLPIA
jgi:hypothetical protein